MKKNLGYNDIKKIVKHVIDEGYSEFTIRCVAYGLNLTACALFCALYKEETGKDVDL